MIPHPTSDPLVGRSISLLFCVTPLLQLGGYLIRAAELTADITDAAHYDNPVKFEISQRKFVEVSGFNVMQPASLNKKFQKSFSMFFCIRSLSRWDWHRP